MSVVRFVLKFIVGLVFGTATALVLSPAFASFTPVEPEDQGLSYFVLIVILAIALLCALAPNARRCFGRGFLAMGAAFVLLPISALMLSGTVGSQIIAEAGEEAAAATAIGAGAGAALVTAAASFFGFILGGLSLIIGLILSLGGQREVVIINR